MKKSTGNDITADELLKTLGAETLIRAIEERGETKMHVSAGVKHLQELIDKPVEQRKREAAQLPRRFAMTPYGAMQWGGHGRGIEKPIYLNSVPLFHLRQAAKQVALLRSIHSVIERDMKQFAKRATREGDIGYEVVHKNEHEESFNPTKQEKEIIDIKKQHVYGALEMPDPQFAKTFHAFMTKTLADHLDIDRIAIGVTYKLDPAYQSISGKMERPVSFIPVDGMTIKPVAQYVEQFMRRSGITSPDHDDYRRGMDELSRKHMHAMHGKTRAADFYELAYLQERNGALVNYFMDEELIIGIGNPRPDIGWYGYGESYVERSIAAILAFTYAFTYNVRQFEDGILPEGIVAVIGEYTQEGMSALRDKFLHQTSGTPLNMNRTPLFNITPEASKHGADIKWVPFRPHNKDMLFHEWMQLVTAFTCANYSVPIEKLQMGKFNAAGSGISEEGGYRMQQMREFSYLRGYLYFYKSVMDEIVRKLHPDLCFEWVGIRPDDEERKLKLISERSSHLTIDEMRSRDGLEAYEKVAGEDMKDAAKVIGGLIPNPQLSGINQQVVQSKLGMDVPGEMPEGVEGEDEGDLEAMLREATPGKGKEKPEEEGPEVEKSVSSKRIANARFKRS